MTIHTRRIGTALILSLWIALGSTLPLAEAAGDLPPTKDPKPTPTQSCADTCKNTPVKNCAGGTCSDVKPVQGAICQCLCQDKCDGAGRLIPKKGNLPR
jgi:hypothetical protein